jgi:hypothetical protein
MPTEATIIFTAKSVERILREGGTSSWRLDRNHARRCPYAICTRNARADWVEGPEAHHSAFLIGRVSDVVRCPATPENNESPNHRYLIEFSEFARVDMPNVWHGDRNPVRYGTLEDFGIDPEKLTWEKMPPVPAVIPYMSMEIEDDENELPPGPVRGLTMAEAKQGLALTFNVPPSSIEITIRG